MPLLHAIGHTRQRIVERAVEELQVGEQAVGPVQYVLEEFALGGDVACFPFVDGVDDGLAAFAMWIRPASFRNTSSTRRS